MSMVSRGYHLHTTQLLNLRIRRLEKEAILIKAHEHGKRQNFQTVIDNQSLQIRELNSAIAELKGKLWTPFTQVISADRQGNPKTFLVEVK
ncbi:MAG: hypothetical protein ACRCTP_04780 [Aeromonas popoffii]|uniref:hypothetical protein n=1 Tax=Aeromonas popoffii TaxID=70856 RepID=UPI003F37D499